MQVTLAADQLAQGGAPDGDRGEARPDGGADAPHAAMRPRRGDPPPQPHLTADPSSHLPNQSLPSRHD